MNIIIIGLSILNVIVAVQIAPSAYKIFLPQNALSTFFSRKPSFLGYSTGLSQNYVDGVRNVFG